MKSWVLAQMKKRERIYILPTRMGGYFNGLIFLMILLSVGYSNNLLLIFTLLLFGLNLLWVVQTHFHLHQLKLDRIDIQNGHAGEAVPFNIRWKKSPSGPHKWFLKLECDEGDVLLTPPFITLQRRGKWIWSSLLISTERPFGLYRAMRYLKVEGAFYVYPAMSKERLNVPFEILGLDGDVSAGGRGEGDFSELLPYSGEEARKISWKHYARRGELFIKEGEEDKRPLARFKWSGAGTNLKEELLSSLATQMVICYRQSIPFTFEFDGVKRGPSVGARHLALCLQDLARC